MTWGEQHPIQERLDLPVERRVQLLEIHLAQLWDHCWWVNLPWWRRGYYYIRGFRDPILKFYIEADGD